MPVALGIREPVQQPGRHHDQGCAGEGDRQRCRKRDGPLMVLLVAAVSGLSAVLVDHPGAVATLWVAAAVVCACRTRICRPYEPGN
ncbi:hypothetical protein [Streptomyces sp. NPDC002104]